jgi:hypothetical protein
MLVFFVGSLWAAHQQSARALEAFRRHAAPVGVIAPAGSIPR